MGTEIQKTSSETLETARKLYAASQAKTLAEMLYLMGQQYRKDITAEVSAFWKEILIERERLSPAQIREGFMGYFANAAKCAFPPQPGDIIGEIPEQPAPKENATLNEMRDLERRQAGGEKFYGFADVLRGVKERGVKLETAIKPMPNVRTVFPDIDPGRNAEELKKQADALRRQERARASAGDRD